MSGITKLMTAGGGGVALTPASSIASDVTVNVPSVNCTLASDANGTLYPLTSGTAQASTSGTSIDFTGIPSWVKRITVMFNGVSTNGTSVQLIQIGDSGGIEITGYIGTGTSSSTGASPTHSNFTVGFGLNNGSVAAQTQQGIATIALLDSTTNSWAFSFVGGRDNAVAVFGAGAKSLSSTLDRIRITTVNGTDTFDAGSINILYE